MMTIEEVAKVCHETNRAYCEALGDTSQPIWENAPDWQKHSAINGVKFHLENPDASPSASHDNWLLEKKLGGWIYGPEKNQQLRTHPCVVEFEDLPLDQQVKDILFKSVVESLKCMMTF